MSAEKKQFSSIHRRTQASIDLSALKHNATIAKEHAPLSSLIAVIKANAYGHGLLECAEPLMEVAEELAVASLDDALYLRENLKDDKVVITVLSGFYRLEEIDIAAKQGVSLVVYDYHQLALLAQSSVNGYLSQTSSEHNSLKIWLKVDTGMSRLGFSLASLSEVIEKIESYQLLEIRGVVSHFANADDPEHELNQKQLHAFSNIKKRYEEKPWAWSMANSAGLLGIKASHHDWIRAGIMLYGSSPLIADSADSLGLLPVMTLSSELISIREVQQGESIGYGSTWIVDKTTKVGVVACGYGDGYPRQISENTPVLVNGQRSTILGRVSMDLIVVDLSNVDAEISSEVILWGKGLPIDEIAQSAGTIAYELMCGITHRVKKVHINS